MRIIKNGCVAVVSRIRLRHAAPGTKPTWKIYVEEIGNHAQSCGPMRVIVGPFYTYEEATQESLAELKMMHEARLKNDRR